MTYPISEASKHDGKPNELYRFEGTYQNYYYTTSRRVISYQADDEDEPHDYAPLGMRRSALQGAMVDEDGGELTVDLPVGTDLVIVYGFQIAPPDLTLTIFRGHEDGEYIRYWGGEVEDISVSRGTATIRIPSALAAALGMDFPTVYYQTPCNHTLFDGGCQVVFDDWSEETTITVLDGRSVTVASIGALDGMLVGGDLMLPSGERRMIVEQTGTLLTINYPFAGAEVTDTVIIATGCDLAWKGDCSTRYANTARFGGYPLIPPDNVFRDGIEPGKDVADETCLPEVPEPVVFEGWDYRLRAVFTTTVCGVGGIGFQEIFGPPNTGHPTPPDAAYWPDVNPGSVGAGVSAEVITYLNAHDAPGHGTAYDSGPSFNDIGDGTGDWAVRLSSFLINYAGGDCPTNLMRHELYFKPWNGAEVLVGDTGFVNNSGADPWFYFNNTVAWDGIGRGADNSSGYAP